MAGRALAGKVIIVPVGDGTGFGVGDGIGGAAPDLARHLAAEGASVVLVATAEHLEDAGRLASDLQASGAARLAVFALDPNDPGTLDALVDFVAELNP